MAHLIYDADGFPQGFRLSNHIYALDGTPIGRVWAEKAYKLDGTFVGVLLKDMVVDRPDVSRRDVAPIPKPPRERPVLGAERRRPSAVAFPSVFHLLTPSSDDALHAADANGPAEADDRDLSPAF